MILYDRPGSSNALKVRFLLCELGIPYERREVPSPRPRPAWYLAINPLGGVPAIDDDGFVLAESNTILRYLAARERRTDLYPDEPRPRARVDEFLDRWSATLRPAFYDVEAPTLGLGGRTVDPDAAMAAAAGIGATLELLDGLIAGETVLDHLTIADFAIAPILFRAAAMPIDLTPFPRILALREALVARPSFIAAEPVR